MKRWLYYTQLAARDLARLWSSTQHHVIIVTGICLPILLLLGLKEGHVAQLRKDLVTSPTGRQIVFWSAQGGALLDGAKVRALEKELPHVDLIIPETQRMVALGLPKAGAAEENSPRRRRRRPSSRVTLYSTRPGDPILAQAGADVLEPGERAVVLARRVADALGVQVGDAARLTVERERGGARESASVEVSVKAVIDFGAGRGAIGYASSEFVDWLEQYVRGYKVEALGWPALKAPARDQYAGYLVFCERANDLTENDRGLLRDRGLQLERVEDEKVRSLYGLLKEDAAHDLSVYRLTTATSQSDPRRRLALAPSAIAAPLESDCVVLAWNEPWRYERGDQTIELIGVSMPESIWLRHYLRTPDKAFDYEAPAFQAQPLSGAASAGAAIEIPLGEQESFALPLVATGITPDAEEAAKTDPQPPALNPQPSPTTNHQYVVPANLLAYLDAYHHGAAVYDAQVRLFVPVPAEPVYDKARLYAATIDDVPALVAALSEKQFALMSESSRISEIHEQDASLRLLVLVVGVGVFAFGVVTVFSVLVDSTDRKRNTIGILRVMGVSRGGVFYLVLLRAAAIGVLAGLISVAVGYGAALLLASPAPAGNWLASWKPNVAIVLNPFDIGLVFLGALICSGAGALWPAWRASRMDPFDAVVEGRFR